jgi:hypothetical protein
VSDLDKIKTVAGVTTEGIGSVCVGVIERGEMRANCETLATLAHALLTRELQAMRWDALMPFSPQASPTNVADLVNVIATARALQVSAIGNPDEAEALYEPLHDAAKRLAERYALPYERPERPKAPPTRPRSWWMFWS